MKNKGCMTAFVPLCIFGCAAVGMILMIMGGESETTPLMIVGGIVIAAGVAVGAIVSAVLRNIEKNNSSSGFVGSAVPDAPVPAVDDDDDEDESEMSDARLEALLASGIPEKRTVEALMDREDALTELMARRGMTDLNEEYVEEADPLWDTYTGEYMSEAVDNLFELVYKYYARYKKQLNAREKETETEASFTASAAENRWKIDIVDEIENGEKIEQSAESEGKTTTDGSYTARTEIPPAPAEPTRGLHVEKPKEAPAFTPPTAPIPTEAPASTHSPTGKQSAAVGYKPMKKK